ncbi:hypothetical protein TSAR_004230 [Trichomalopsis sarcophagae]|uniref:Uncharacterized protein n=1 Tax=Trichomalopsis sarcophagae TaxID=543379 RepID=A0A232EQ50_9HYME|nr:hypothetical protein TSAR_004230 [Trichomalopsis sarcophagae]
MKQSYYTFKDYLFFLNNFVIRWKKTTDNPEFNVHYGTEDCEISTFANYNVDDVRFITEGDLYNNNVPGRNAQRIEEIEMQNSDLNGDKSAKSSPAKCVPCVIEPVVDLEIRSMNDEDKENGKKAHI